MVCTQDKLKWLGVGFILTANLVGCSKKDSADPAAIVEIPQTVVSSGQPATILSGSGPIMLPTSLSGLPSDPSSATSISITVSGQGLTEYRYAITKDIGNCNDATYSDPRSPSVTIDEAITEDGIWSVCVLAAGVDSQGVPKVASLSHSWMHDSTAPSVSILAPSGFGPNISGNSNFTIALSASDGGSGLTSVGVSLQRAGGNCLNQDRSAFDANCPTFIETIGNNLSLTIPSEEFESEVNYIFTAMAIDATGNSQASSSLTLNWDATSPAAPAALTAVPGQELANLSWSSVSGAAYYAVARRLGSPVDGVPLGSGLVSGITFGGSNLIVYFGSNNSFQDTELLPFQNYHYEVFALDAAKNISTSGAKAKAQPDAKPAFQGLTYAYLQADRGIKTEWQQFAFAGNQASTVYDIYQSTVSNDLLTGGSDTQTTGASSLTFPIEDENASDAYLVARASAPGYSQDRNKRELRVKLSSGVMHKIASNGRFDGSEPLGQTFLRNAWTVDIDPWGNSVFTATNGTIQVLCRESAQAYYCKGRTNGAVYTIAGTDGIEDGADGMLASASPMGQIYGIDFDSSGNLYVADYTYARVRVICFNPLAPGFCNAKEIGFSYHIAGTGTVVDGGNDTVARTTPIGLPNDIAIDSFGNIFFADSSYRRIRAVCYVASGPICSGKVLGNMFHVAGNGILADGADASARLTANFGEPRALAIDSLNNLWFADWDYRRIRAVCLDVASSGSFCTGKTSGLVYRVMGTGAAVDGGDNVAANTEGMGQAYGLAVSNHNIYVSDSTFPRIRVICQNTSVTGFCSGKTAGRVYRTAGSGAATDGANNTIALVAALGGPRHLDVDQHGNIVVADDTSKRLRLICKVPASGSLCSGRFSDYHYHLVGNGSATLGWQTDAMTTPIGTPLGTAIDAAGNVFVGDATNIVVRVICNDIEADGPCLGKTKGASYFVAGTGVTGDGLDNSFAIATSIGAPSAIDLDSLGNLYIADSTNRRIRVVCFNLTSGFCAGKSIANMYRLAFTGVSADGADNATAATATMGTPAGMELDQFNNIYIADSTFPRIRILCQNTSGGFCSGRTAGNVYRRAGTGASANGANNALATATATGVPTDLAVDPWGNVFFGDTTFPRVRAICNNTSGGFCAGRTAGNVYWFAGTGTTGDGAANVLATAGAISTLGGIVADSLGNIFLGDQTARRIRAICVDTSSGYCSGLTVNNMYPMYGNGAALTDSASGIAGSLVRLDTPSRDGLDFNAAGDLIYGGSSGALRLFIGY
jgi:sugar lactone lactonase YvrE